MARAPGTPRPAGWGRAGVVLADPLRAGGYRAALRDRRPALGGWRTSALCWPSACRWNPATPAGTGRRGGAASGVSAPPLADRSVAVMCLTPSCPGPTYPPVRMPGECWAIEAELTPKPLARTAAIMTGLLARTAGYSPAPRQDPGRATTGLSTWPPRPRAASSTAGRRQPARAPLQARVTVRDLPAGAVL